MMKRTPPKEQKWSPQKNDGTWQPMESLCKYVMCCVLSLEQEHSLKKNKNWKACVRVYHVRINW